VEALLPTTERVYSEIYLSSNTLADLAKVKIPTAKETN
jgi:hypothetical protein